MSYTFLMFYLPRRWILREKQKDNADWIYELHVPCCIQYLFYNFWFLAPWVAIHFPVQISSFSIESLCPQHLSNNTAVVQVSTEHYHQRSLKVCSSDDVLQYCFFSPNLQCPQDCGITGQSAGTSLYFCLFQTYFPNKATMPKLVQNVKCIQHEPWV